MSAPISIVSASCCSSWPPVGAQVRGPARARADAGVARTTRRRGGYRGARVFADVLVTALKCDPDERYQSASEFDTALTAVEKQLDANRRPTRREWLALTAAGVTGVAGILAWRAFSVRVPPGARAIQSIAVLPFVNLSGDPAQEYFVDGMTDGLINALCRISAVSVKARTSVMAFKGSKKSFGEIAHELKVDAIVEGSAVLTSNGAEVVRIAVNVIDAATQTQLWSTALERSLQAVLTIHVDLARAIAANIRVALTNDEQRRLAAAGQTVDPETFKLYLLGRQEWAGRTVPTCSAP